MFDIGWSELLVIAVVTIIVVGPKDLPRLLRSVGQIARKLRQTANEFRGHLDDVIRDAELEDLKSTMQDVKSLNPMEQVKKAVMDDVGGVRDIIEDDGVRNYHKDFPDDEPFDDFDDPGAEWDDDEDADGLTGDPLFDGKSDGQKGARENSDDGAKDEAVDSRSTAKGKTNAHDPQGAEVAEVGETVKSGSTGDQTKHSKRGEKSDADGADNSAEKSSKKMTEKSSRKSGRKSGRKSTKKVANG